jgi:hypothetical protein
MNGEGMSRNTVSDTSSAGFESQLTTIVKLGTQAVGPSFPDKDYKL